MPVRIFVVDDSATSRAVLRRIVATDPGLAVVGEASSGEEALRTIPRARPDIVLMDVVLAGIDGIETTERLLRSCAVPVLIVSERVGRDAHLAFRALEAGALDLVRKPAAGDDVAGFLRKISLLAGLPVVTRRLAQREPPAARRPPTTEASFGRASLVAIGASTGGPPAILQVLRGLPNPSPVPVVIVQHMTAGFVEGFADWLGKSSGRHARVAAAGEVPAPDTVYLAPDNHHLGWSRGALALSTEAPDVGHRPSVDAWFRSLARSEHAARTIAVLLTGMGADGAAGLLALRDAGSWTLAQDEATSVVYGMPGAAAKLGAAREILPLGEIAPRVTSLLG